MKKDWFLHIVEEKIQIIFKRLTIDVHLSHDCNKL